MLYNCYEIQPNISFEEKNSIFLRNLDKPKIDHMFVSEEFTNRTHFKFGKIINAQYLSKHLLHDRPEISDHGLLVVTIQLK